jgi:hypothetical protein
MQNIKPNLKIGWATHESSKYACENWHYSKCIPVNKLVKIGVWENKKFIGVVIYGYGTSPKISHSYGLEFFDVCELVRVALTKHMTPVSKILSISLKFLKKHCPNIKLVVSFADQNQGHHGGIYQATNWIYSGETGQSKEIYYKGEKINQMSLRHKKNRSDFNQNLVEYKMSKPKHRYLMPLCDDIKEKINKLKKPYPKRVEHKSNASNFQLEESGAVPTNTLQLQDNHGSTQ